ncbi:MAG: hypothetical protein IKB04_06565 [Clostridia bacterium]|nr:hypothetical protein [Clostridia bacterium]
MSQITPDQLQALLAYASRQLGMTPEQLAKTVQSGGLDAVSNSVSPDNARRISELVGDPQKAEQFLSSPEVQKLLGKLLGGH